MRLDHLAITCADLASGTRWAEEALGVTFGPGGRHERFGTHNRLIGLADGLYLEVIAPDPEATIRGPRWFGLDTPPATPTLGNWIVATDDIASAPAAFGEVVPLERDGLTCVKIIHGKGLRSGPHGPRLKQMTASLLIRRDRVVAFASARPNDGGTGAVYVLLDRRR